MWNNFDSNPHDECLYPYEGYAYLALLIYGLGWAIHLGITFQTKLSGIHDGLKLKRDIKVIVIIWPIELGIWAISEFFLQYRSLQTVSSMLAFAATFWLTTGLAMIETYNDNSYLSGNEDEDDEEVDISTSSAVCNK